MRELGIQAYRKADNDKNYNDPFHGLKDLFITIKIIKKDLLKN